MATSEVQTVHSGADKAKLAVAVALLLGSFVAFYLLSAQGALAQWGALIVLLAGCGGGVRHFRVRQAIAGLRPGCLARSQEGGLAGRKEAIQMTAYVFAFVFVMALFLWLTDKTVEWVFYDLILGWRK